MQEIMNILCRIGYHNWAWGYESPQSCKQGNYCRRCRKLTPWHSSIIVSHDWGEWSFSIPDSCVQLRNCKRCGTEEKGKTIHAWGQWQLVSEGSCQEQVVCARCKESETRVAHHWPEFAYVAPESCEALRKCLRCGKEESEIRHQWKRVDSHKSNYDIGDSGVTEITDTFLCGRCSEKRVEEQRYEGMSSADQRAYGYPSNWTK